MQDLSVVQMGNCFRIFAMIIEQALSENRPFRYIFLKSSPSGASYDTM